MPLITCLEDDVIRTMGISLAQDRSAVFSAVFFDKQAASTSSRSILACPGKGLTRRWMASEELRQTEGQKPHSLRIASGPSGDSASNRRICRSFGNEGRDENEGQRFILQAMIQGPAFRFGTWGGGRGQPVKSPTSLVERRRALGSQRTLAG